MNHIYGDNLHPEIIRRASEIPKFLSKRQQLTLEDLDLMWEASSGKHESVKHLMQQALTDLSGSLVVEQAEYLYQKLRSLSFADWDLVTMNLFRSLCLRCLNHGGTGDREHYHGFDIAWDLVQDETETTETAREQAFLFVRDFLRWDVCQRVREPMMTRCCQNLEQSKSIPSSLRILQDAFCTYSAVPLLIQQY